MITTLIILAVTAVFFVIGKIRSDIVALCSLILLMAFGILTPTEALSGFSNSVVIMMVGLFVVGGAVFQTGLAKMISGKIMHLAGDNETRLFLLVMLTTTAIGAFVSNTGTVALMLPIVVSMAAKGNISASRLLMPLAFASSLGGMLTLIGTPPNLVIQEALANAGYGTLGFFSFTPVGIIAIAIGIIVLMPLSKWLLSNKDKDGSKKKKRTKSLQELVDEYHLADQLTRYVIPKGSELNDKTLMELDIQNRYNLSVMEIRREKRGRNGWIRDVSQKMAGPKTRFMEGDIIYLSGEPGQMERFATDYKLKQPVTKQKGNAQNKMDFYDIGIAELVIMPNTTLQNHKIKESGFRSKYNINIVAVRRNGNYILNNLAEVSLHAGDVLLVQGTWANISRLTHEDEHWVVLGQPLAEAEKVTLDYKAPLAAIIMLAMIAMMVFDFIPIEPVTAVMIAGVLMVLTGCFRNVEAAYKTINWETIVLIAAMMPMSVALEKTGASAMISQSLVSGLGAYGPYALLAGIYFTTSLLTMFISNTATAVLMAPIALSSALGLHLNPTAFLFAVSLGGGPLYIHGLRQSRPAASDHHRHSHGVRLAIALPTLKSSRDLSYNVRLLQEEFHGAMVTSIDIGMDKSVLYVRP